MVANNETEIKAESESSTESKSSGFYLERRAGGGASRQDSASVTKAKKATPIAAEALMAQLERLCQRFKKDNSEFCIASLLIPEFKSLKSTNQCELAESVDKTALQIMTRYLRNDDRICIVAPSRYLILMPLTARRNGERALERIVDTISRTAVRHKSKSIRPSPIIKIVSASELRSNSDWLENETSEAVLALIGYATDRQGELGSVDDASDVLEPLAFSGSFEIWRDRYDGAEGLENQSRTIPSGDQQFQVHWCPVRDLWADGASRDLRVITCKSARADFSRRLLSRLRLLQRLDHPGLSRLIDFFISSDGRTYLVNLPVDGIILEPLDDGAKPDVKTLEILSNRDDHSVLRWSIQMLSSLVSLTSLSPPLIPSSFLNMKVLLSPQNGTTAPARVVLAGYDMEYLTEPFFAVYPEEAESVTRKHYLREMAEFLLSYLPFAASEDEEVDRDLRHLLEDLKNNSSPQTSLLKVRNALRALDKYPLKNSSGDD